MEKRCFSNFFLKCGANDKLQGLYRVKTVGGDTGLMRRDFSNASNGGRLEGRTSSRVYHEAYIAGGCQFEEEEKKQLARAAALMTFHWTLKAICCS